MQWLVRLSFLLCFVSAAAQAEKVSVAQILNRSDVLTSQDFEQLWQMAKTQKFDPGLDCQAGVVGEQTALPDVFEDPEYEKLSSADPVFQRIKLYLHMNEATKIVPQHLLPQFVQYAKAFYLLYSRGLILKPDLRSLALEQAADLMDFYLDEHNAVFASPTTTEESEAFATVTSQNLPLTDHAKYRKSFSAAMVEIFSKIAQFPSVCNSSAAEAAALGIYIGSGFTTINPYLRNKVENNVRLDLLEKLINQALKKLGDTEGLVFRTTLFLTQPDMPEGIYRSHRAGAVLTYNAFTSTASSPPTNANFLIYSRTGESLGALSGEREVLFRSYSKFKVRYNSCEERNLPVWQGCRVLLEEML